MAAAGEGKELKKTKSGLRQLSRGDSHSSPFLLDEPYWIPDNEKFNCQGCDKKFDFLNRKHHCRRCGRIYCGNCVNQKLALPRLSFIDPVRMCADCATATRKESEFFDKNLKALTNGANFLVIGTSHTEPDAERPFLCKLSPSTNRFIEFQGGTETHDKIDIGSILTVKVLATNSDSGNTVASGLTLTYKDANDKEQTVTFRAKTDKTKRDAMAWIVSMQKAMKMLFEARSSSSADG